MNRTCRVAVEILAPPLVAFALAVAFLQLEGPTLGTGDLKELAQLLGFAYLVSILPSLLFAMLMEAAFARWFNPRSGLTVLLGAGLGALCGLGVNFILRNVHDEGLLRFLVALGVATGGVVGLVVFAGARLARERRPGELTF